MTKIVKNAIVDAIFAVLFLTFGILMLVLPDFGMTVLQYIIAAVLLLYVIGCLFGEIRTSRGKVQVLVVVEALLLLLVAVGLVINSLKIINLGSACQIFGVAVWLRGTVDVCRSYFAHGTDSQKKYPFWRLIIAVLLVSFGAYVFAKPFISDPQLVIVIAVCLILVALLFLYFAIKYWPKKRAKKSKKS